MMKSKCPFCNRKFVRDPRSLLSNKFCSYCIEQRVFESGGIKIGTMDKFIITDDNYVFFDITSAKA